jgi:iron complex outermembrane recepter protein
VKFHNPKAALRAKPFAAASAMVLALAANPVLAQDASEEGDVGEIIVTAQKRAQSLSDVSLSVSAVGAEALASSNTAGLEGLQNLVPSVSFGNDFNFAKLFIRGIGLSSSLPGVDPSVALHVDGAVVSLAQAQLGSLFDLERVEVLRGPQGTLYGRNATGGAVNLITAKPSATTKGYVRLTVGGDDLNVIGEAAVGGPITDKIRGRLAFRAVRREGYGINEFTGNDIDNANQFSTRAHLEFLPSEKVNVLLTGEYHEEDDRSLAIKFRSLSFPGVLTDAIPQNDGLSALGQRLNADGSPAAFARGARNLNTNFDPINDRKQYAFTGAVSIEASDDITLKSLTSYRKFDAIFFHDFDASTYLGFPLAQTGPTRSSANHFQPVFQNQFTQEFQANIDTDKFNGVFGLFYLKENIEALNHIGFDVLTNSDPFRVQFDGKLDVKTFAAFANATFELSDQLAIKGGARYSHEKRFLANNRGIGTAAGFVRDPTQFNQGRTFNNFSPSLGLEFRPNDDLLLYGNWSRGFKSGTAEIGSGTPTAAIPSPFVKPEKVEAFEVGAKYSGSTLKVNLAGFFQRLKNGQFSLTRPIPAPPFFTSTLTNAAVSEGYGADLEILWRPADAFTLNASVAYLHSEFTEFTASDPLDGRLFAPGAVASQLVRDLSGNATRNSPKWSVNLNPTFDIKTGNGANVQLASNFAYRSRQFHTEFNDARLGQKGYIQLDANILYTSPSERVTANLWVKNITDEFVYSGSFAISTSRIIGGTLQPPRTYGITLGYKY